MDELKQRLRATWSQIRSNNWEIKSKPVNVCSCAQWCPGWEYFNCASYDHSTRDIYTEGDRGHSWWSNVKKNQEFLPSLDFFFRTRVPPNFPRKDSSFLIFADCVVPDIFQCEWCVCGLSLVLFPLSVNNVTLSCDAFRHQCSIQSRREDSKQPRMQTEGRSFAWASRYRAMTHMWVKKPRLLQSFTQRPLPAGWGRVYMVRGHL